MVEAGALTRLERTRAADVLILCSTAEVGAAVFQRVSGAGFFATLCPLAMIGNGKLLDPDLVLLVTDDEASELVDWCSFVRERTDSPIVAITRQPGERLVASALEAGADEVLLLSIGDIELRARIEAMLRRHMARSPESWCVAGMTIFFNDLSVELLGRRIALTPIEFRLLTCLASAPGKAFTHETLMSRVWGAEYVDARHYLYLYIRYLREKLEPDPTTPRIIVSEWGIGYRLQPPAVVS